MSPIKKVLPLAVACVDVLLVIICLVISDHQKHVNVKQSVKNN